MANIYHFIILSLYNGYFNGYQIGESIENINNEQYIDLEFKPNLKTTTLCSRFNILQEPKGYRGVLGSRDSGGIDATNIFYTPYEQLRMDWVSTGVVIEKVKNKDIELKVNGGLAIINNQEYPAKEKPDKYTNYSLFMFTFNEHRNST